MFYYNENTPQSIANTVMSINMDENYNSRFKLFELDKEFVINIEGFISKGNHD